MDDFASFMSRIRSELIRLGVLKPGISIDGQSGCRRRNTERSVVISPNRRKPAPPAQIVPPLAPIKRGRGRPKKTVPDHLKTTRTTLHHDWSGSERVEVRIQSSIDIRIARWQRKNERLKCLSGGHIDLFVRDWEIVNASIRSPDLMGAGGAKSVAKTLPEMVIESATRLRTLEKVIGPGPYALLVAVVIYGYGPSDLHAHGAAQHVVVSHQIRDAVNSLASFYSPAMMQPNRTWEAAKSLLKSIEKGIDL